MPLIVETEDEGWLPLLRKNIDARWQTDCSSDAAIAKKQSAREQIRAQLLTRLLKMLETGADESLLQGLYRLDIDEDLVKRIFRMSDLQERAQRLTDAILAREEERARYQFAFTREKLLS